MKQYLMIRDESAIRRLQEVFRKESIQFLEVQGMAMTENAGYNILVTPIIPPVNPVLVQEDVKPTEVNV